MLICAICGKHLRTQYLCSSVLSVGDSLCCLRFILPQIPQIFTDFMYPSNRIHPRYLWEQPSHPISVFICAICGRFLRTLTYVGDSLCSLRFILPRIPQIFTDFIYPNIRAHLCYPWETPSHPISVFICDICGSHHLHLEIILPRIPRIFTDFDYFEINIRVIIEICVLLRTQYPCSSVLSVGDSLCCLRFDFSHGFHRFSQILCIPVSVFIRAICGNNLRTQYPCSSAISVGATICSLRFILPQITDFHRFYVSQYPYSSALSVGTTFAPNIRVHLCYLWEISSAA